MDITPENSLEPDAAARLQEGHDLVLLLAGIFFGPILLAAFLKPVRDVFVQWHILVTENVLIPFGDGVGLDLPRVVIALCIVGALVTLAVIVFRRHVAKKESESK